MTASAAPGVLKACPFCGAAAKLCQDGAGWHLVACTSCGASMEAKTPTIEARIVEEWNTRAPAEVTEEMVERLINLGCNAADFHLKCSYPKCGCKALPAAIRAFLAEHDRQEN